MDDLKQLRELLLDDDRAVISQLRARIDELELQRRELAARFPELLAEGLGEAVQSKRQHIVDALFPVIGPAIRKAIAAAARDLVDDINMALESSFTLRGLRWRLEAWRSGVPYAQVVLKHRLAYRIDHVFLIERGSGLVLHHAAAEGLAELDADAVAGMLTAIGAFVTDSMGGEIADSLESAQVGEHLVWVMGGPQANLACFIRGVPPAGLRALLARRLEEIHASGSSEQLKLDSDQLGQDLYPHTIVHALSSGQQHVQRPRRLSAPLLVLMLGVLTLTGWQAWRMWHWRADVAALRTELLHHPGFVLHEIDARRGSSLRVRGLLDADAPPLHPLAGRRLLSGVQPVFETAGYLSSDDAVVERRARRLLAAPDSAVVQVKDGHLAISGQAPADWLEFARERAAWVAGVAGTDINAQATVDPRSAARQELRRLEQQIAARWVGFEEDIQPDLDGMDAVAELAAMLHSALQLESPAGVLLEFEITGMNDPSGADALNRQLREQRADWLLAQLVQQGIDPSRVRVLDVDAAATDVRGARVSMRQVRDP